MTVERAKPRAIKTVLRSALERELAAEQVGAPLDHGLGDFLSMPPAPPVALVSADRA
ncbi:MAG TPA: hypothetical protein VL977_00360 [Solirubrobacteraceae bacterium]|nr:hypothetical protein [Solirubrobacteraceae bacterium]